MGPALDNLTNGVNSSAVMVYKQPNLTKYLTGFVQLPASRIAIADLKLLLTKDLRLIR